MNKFLTIEKIKKQTVHKMAGGDFMQINETRKQAIQSNYESDIRKNLGDDECKSIKHTNPAMYIESFHDNKVNESESYVLDLSSLDNPSTCRTTILTSDAGSFATDRSETLKNTEIRYINSAIFIEHVDSCDEEIEYNDKESYQSTYRKTDLRQSAQLTRTHAKKLTGKSVVNIPQHVKSATNYGTNLKFKSSTHTDMYSTEDESRPRRLTFDEWLASKQQLTNRPKKVSNDEKTDNIDNEHQRRRRMDEQREDFKRWLAIKREQDKLKKKELEVQKEKIKREEELKNQRFAEKESMLKSWIQRKDEQLKEKKRREEMRKKKLEEEKKMRKELSAKAFEEWKEKSKYNPRPVPLNMGVESLRGSISAIQFVNPTPWQENIDLRQSSA
ncbi:coiled-coil domain-containing protein 34-like [Chrysoperla carnea]|uniref:coiled-coil domain-containing protein 34-like n=1 Tax=Chrysoperla carnea TaxID=189513 RepID=UPI001D084BA0|nr:coiled-coil domain-containing protein 34-like [Chrysoperla carnea]